MRLPIALVACLLSACTTFPELDAATSAETRTAPYPALAPIEAFATAETGRITPDTTASIQARAAALRARAAAMQGPVTDPATRARLAAAIAAHAG